MVDKYGSKRPLHANSVVAGMTHLSTAAKQLPNYASQAKLLNNDSSSALLTLNNYQQVAGRDGPNRSVAMDSIGGESISSQL